MALDTTVGGANSDSYVSVTEANAYFATHWSTAKNTLWNTLNGVQRERVLRAACQVLEGLRCLDAEYGGGALPTALMDLEHYDVTIHRLGFTQKLQFPRNIDIDANNVGFIRQEIKDAQCEQALYLIAFDDSQISTYLQGVYEESVSAGNVRVHTTFNRRGTMVAPMALQLMTPYLRRNQQRSKRA